MLWRQALEGRGAAWSAKAAVKARQQARGDIMGPATSQVPLSPLDGPQVCSHMLLQQQPAAGDNRNQILSAVPVVNLGRRLRPWKLLHYAAPGIRRGAKNRSSHENVTKQSATVLFTIL